jgi:hypothetical protein
MSTSKQCGAGNIATVGKTPEKVFLVGSSDDEVKQCVEQIKDFSEKLGYAVETVEAAIQHYLDIEGETDKERLRRFLERLADMGVIKEEEIDGIIETF